MALQTRLECGHGGQIESGTATLANGTIAVTTKFPKVYSAVAIFSADPGVAASIYATVSGGTVTFNAGNLSVGIYYHIVGHL